MDIAPAALRYMLDTLHELTRAPQSDNLSQTQVDAYRALWSPEGIARMKSLYAAMKTGSVAECVQALRAFNFTGEFIAAFLYWLIEKGVPGKIGDMYPIVYAVFAVDADAGAGVMRSGIVSVPDFRAYVWREVLLMKPSCLRGLDFAVFLREMSFLGAHRIAPLTFHGLVGMLLMVNAGEQSLTGRLDAFVADEAREILIRYRSPAVLQEQTERYTQKLGIYKGRGAEAIFQEVAQWLQSRR